MAMRVEDIGKRLLDTAVDGIGIWVIGKVVEYAKPYTVKTLKQYNDAVVKIGLSLLDYVIPQVKTVPYLGDWLGLAGRRGVEDALRVIVDKVPLCWAEDANTIKCINFDTTGVSVKVNGTTPTMTISGTPEEFTISLAAPLATGSHDLVVAGNTKAWSGKIYV